MTGIELKARRLRFIDKITRRAFTQPQFANMLHHNPNSIAIMERRGFQTVAQQRYGLLLDWAISWLEIEYGMEPWPSLEERERKQRIKQASTIVRSDELDPRVTRSATKGKVRAQARS